MVIARARPPGIPARTEVPLAIRTLSLIQESATLSKISWDNKAVGPSSSNRGISFGSNSLENLSTKNFERSTLTTGSFTTCCNTCIAKSCLDI